MTFATKARLELSYLKTRSLVTYEETEVEYVAQSWKGGEHYIKADGKVYELKEDRFLFPRMMLACKSRPEIDIKNAIGLHEFSVVPRSLFGTNGTMFHCTN